MISYMTQVHLRLPDELKKLAERYANKHGYKNLQELAKEAVRAKIMEESVEDATKGEDLFKELPAKTRKLYAEISENEWKRSYKEMRKKEWSRTKSLMRTS